MAPRKKTRKVVPQQAGDAITVSNRGRNSASAGRGVKAVIPQAATASELKKWRKNMEKWIDAKKDLPPASKRPPHPQQLPRCEEPFQRQS